jgi:hypothetical protein
MRRRCVASKTEAYGARRKLRDRCGVTFGPLVPLKISEMFGREEYTCRSREGAAGAERSSPKRQGSHSLGGWLPLSMPDIPSPGARTDRFTVRPETGASSPISPTGRRPPSLPLAPAAQSDAGMIQCRSVQADPGWHIVWPNGRRRSPRIGGRLPRGPGAPLPSAIPGCSGCPHTGQAVWMAVDIAVDNFVDYLPQNSLDGSGRPGLRASWGPESTDLRAPCSGPFHVKHTERPRGLTRRTITTENFAIFRLIYCGIAGLCGLLRVRSTAKSQRTSRLLHPVASQSERNRPHARVRFLPPAQMGL